MPCDSSLIFVNSSSKSIIASGVLKIQVNECFISMGMVLYFQFKHLYLLCSSKYVDLYEIVLL